MIPAAAAYDICSCYAVFFLNYALVAMIAPFFPKSEAGNAVGSGEVTIGQTAAGRSATTVDVTYTYNLTEVPEPSTYAAMGFVGLVAGATIWRRRQMAKKA
jgi:hypothetical protein